MLDGNTPSDVNRYRIINETKLSEFNEYLQNVQWDLVYSAKDPNVAMCNFDTIFKACFNKFFPIQEKAAQKNHKPYITPEIKELKKKRNVLQRKLAKKQITFKYAFHRVRDKVTTEIRT